MWKLTQKEQAIILVIVSVLLTGAGVKAFRASHSSSSPSLIEKL